MSDPTAAGRWTGQLAVTSSAHGRLLQMSEVPGRPIWVELWTSDQAVARDFYAPVLGWTVEATWPELGDYLTFLRDGEPAAGCMPNATGGPDAWLVYLESADITLTTSLAETHGGTVVVEAEAIADLGHQAFVTDPGGAMVGVWQPGALTGFAGWDQGRSPAWFELLTTEYDATVAFYEQVFGWWDHEGGAEEARTTSLGRRTDAGAAILDAADLLPGLASHWEFHLRVDDTDAVVARAAGLGAEVLLEPADSPVGRLATLRDPVGAAFTVTGPLTHI